MGVQQMKNTVGRILLGLIILSSAVFGFLSLYADLSSFSSTRTLNGELAGTINFEENSNLQDETKALLPLFDNMPPVPVFVKDEPILKKGTSIEKGVAYTNCDAHRTPSIFIKKIFHEKANRIMLVNILKHELTHAWLCRQGISAGHDERFRRKFEQVGGFGN